jgi:hypothetical protein
MPETKPQSFKNHARFDPSFHFFLVPALILNIALCITHAWHHPHRFNIWIAMMSIVLLLMAFLLRTYPLKAQDRVIRLEERLRLERLCDASLRSRIPELNMRQWIALRFASDAELPALAQRAMDEGLSEKQIKAAIQNWRGDYCRI